MASQETGLDSDADFYIPEFLWNFWLETCPVDLSNRTPFSVPPYVGLHVYDTYKNELTTGLSDHPFSRGVFDQIKRHVPEVTEDPAWEEANSAFCALEKDSETAIRSLLQQLDSKTRSSQMYGLSTAKKNDRSDKQKLSLGRHSLQALQKYLIFLRFRNRDTYERLLKLANEGSLFLRNWGTHRSWKHPIWLGNDKRQPFSDWIELLKSFTCFFTGSDSKKCTVAFILDCIHRRFKNIQDAEICIGISSEPDEYILSASCFGVVEEDGVGNLNDTFYYFFPISPHIAIYLLLDAPLSIPPEERISRPHFLHRDAHISSNIDHDVEASLDVYQRNALLLQTLPRYVIFVSSRSMIRTLTYYSERRWIPENLDYSKLLRGCREESVTHTLLVKASIEVIDLTDDVTMIGDYAISYGSFADVWKGVWVDRLDRGKKLVALKVLRANLVGYVHERLLKRLKKEVKAWYRLDHPHVAKLYGVVQLPNSLAMVSPWCENGTVVKYLKEINPDASRLQLLYEIASGVSYLHSCEPVVVHGDLKGCNILVNAAGRALITDFGLAKVKEEMSDVAELPTSFFAGSIRWMAPEIYKAQIEEEWRPLVSTFSDVYAFASVCLELLTGQLPYAHRRSDAVVTLDIMNGVKPSRGLQFVADPKTEVLWSLMNECWDEFPRARPDMRKMCECLEHLVS